jgi:hypothetical protein
MGDHWGHRHAALYISLATSFIPKQTGVHVHENDFAAYG